MPNTTSHWKAASLTAVSEALPQLGEAGSEGARILLVLLCFLTRSEVPLTLCIRGATPRKRWNGSGEIEEVEALHTGLVPELVHTLSSPADLNNALHFLQSESAISRNSDTICFVDPTISARISDNLPLELQSFWRLQALVIAFRSIPWKYLEFEYVLEFLLSRSVLTCPRPLGNLFSAHVRHTVEAVRNHRGFQELEQNNRTDLALALLEASRVPGMEWKRFAIDQAKEVVRGLDDRYLQSCVAQRECVLYRITGDMGQAACAIDKATSVLGPIPATAEKKAHAAFGQIAIQHALNYIQVDDLLSATKELDAWQPLGQTPSAIEEVTLFRKHIILGKISRFEGRFSDSLANLKRSKDLADLRHNLFFNEDRHELVCNLADTLQELERPVDAERYLRNELALLNHDCASLGRLLKLALAESLFSQKRYKEAQTICSEVQFPNLTKMEKLRLAILQAKLCHVSSHLEEAFHYWTEAMRAVSKFTHTKGQTTRIILLSICDILRRQGQHELELQSRDQLTTLEKLAGTGGALYWISGLRQWLDYLQKPNKPRM